MNILVVTPFFKHDKNIASVRWTNIATRLTKKHNVIVVTQPHNDMDMKTEVFTDESGILVARINQKTAYEKFAVKYFGGATGDDWQTSSNSGDEATQTKDSFVRKLKNRVLFASMKSKAKSYARFIVKNVIPADTKIDVVISSACPFIEMMFGYELKKQLKCKWISDFRDLPFIEDNCHSTHIEKAIMQKFLPNADAITVVVSAMKRDLLKNLTLNEEKIYLVTNGFSLLDRIKGETTNDKTLHITHTGSLYGGRRRADLLFSALRIARESKPEYHISLDCAGGNNTSILLTAEKYGCRDLVNDFGFIPRNEALSLQRKSDCLLAMVEPYSLPAKLFEYVLNEKPIICIVMGQNSTESEAKPFMDQLNLGFVVEESNFEEDSHRLARYLISQCERKFNGDKLEYSPHIEAVKEYDHDNIAIKVENIIQNINRG